MKAPLHRAIKSPSGFTLLELMGVLAITLLIIGTMAVSLSFPDDEKKLRAPLDNFRDLAKTGWMRSISEQRAWEIELRASQMVLRPRSAVHAEDQKTFDAADAAAKRGSGEEAYQIKDAVLFIKHFGQDKWNKVEGDKYETWLFEPGGLCEPIQLRVQTEKDWIEVQFDPLTAAVQYENVSD